MLVAWSKSQLFVLNEVRFHIEGLIVSESHRGKSIGKKHMSFVKGLAKHHRPAIIDLTSGLRRAKNGSHEFYKRLGYKMNMDSDTWLRARGWALWKATFELCRIEDKRSHEAAV